MNAFLSILTTGALFFSSCSNASEHKTTEAIQDSIPAAAPVNLQAQAGEQVATFASGCFWCVEEIYEGIDGVRDAVSGYSGGTVKNPTYEQVCTGKTGHAEAVQVYYDPKKVSFKELVHAFFDSHDPTTLNRQGPDEGTQYRSIAFYRTPEEKQIIEQVIAELKKAKTFKRPIVTEVKAASVFYPAEDYHQGYAVQNPDNPYIQSVSVPRYEEFKAKAQCRLKSH